MFSDTIWVENAAAGSERRLMRKNNLKASRKPSARPAVRPAKNGQTGSSNGSTRAKSASTTRVNASARSKTLRTNSQRNSIRKGDPRLRDLLQIGLDRKNVKDYAGAIHAFQRAIAEYPQSGLAHWLLGGMYRTYLHDPQSAVPYFETAVALAPKSKSASLGLFHSLYDLTRTKEATAEMRRFQALTDCTVYREILEDMEREGFDELPARPRRRDARKNHNQ